MHKFEDEIEKAAQVAMGVASRLKDDLNIKVKIFNLKDKFLIRLEKMIHKSKAD